MSSIDLSRSAFQPEKRYTSVRLQQGRIILDDDWNESESITTHERVESLTDIIGPSGTSDDGLLVANAINNAGSVDFALGAGTFYIGGRRLSIPTGFTYRLQDDLFAPPVVAAPVGDRTDLVWVEASEVPITAIEDAELREVGLGGPDTATRTRLVLHVRVEPNVPDDCEAAFETTVGARVNGRGVVETDAELTVGFSANSTPADLCTPAVTGGYLSHLNQAIRVQVADPNTFVWGFDNGSGLYRVDLLADRTTVRFRTQPVDEQHRPRAGQVVELLPWSAVLPNGEVQAGSTGAFAVVDQSFDPDADELTLTAAVPNFGELDWVGRPDQAVLEADGRWMYLRVWERDDDTSGPTLPLNPGGNAVDLGTTGLQVSFTGTEFVPGDHWIIAARPAEPDRVVPWNFTDGRAPHGPVRLRAPLGLIRWNNGVPSAHDCRRRFRPLTEQQGCCEISVGDGSHSFGDVESIQQAIDLLPPEGGRVCVHPGVYDELIAIVDRQNVHIHGCGPDSIVAPSGGNGPVISIENSERIRIDGLRVVALDGEGVLAGSVSRVRSLRLYDLDVRANATHAGIKVISGQPDENPSRWVGIRGCTVRSSNLDAPPPENIAIELSPAIVLQGEEFAVVDNKVYANDSKLISALGGIQVCGLSDDVVLIDNTIEGGNGNGVAIGSIGWIERRRLAEAVGDYAAFAGALILVGWLAWFDGGCIQIGTDPADDDDDDDDDTELVPVSIGPVTRLRISGCRIAGMAGDGVGVVRFFEPVDGEAADIITVEHLEIERNQIHGNRRTPQAEGSAALSRLSGHGGIALALADDVQIRSNSIVDNGSSEEVPTCGVFILSGSGVIVANNDIIDNGADPGDRAPRLGNRGGIVVRRTRPGTVGSHRVGVPEVASLTVRDNRVSQPSGQALWVMGHGAIAVSDNQLIAGALGATDIFAAGLAMLQGDFDELGDVASLALTHLVGSVVTIINLGLPIDLRVDNRFKGLDAAPGLNQFVLSHDMVDGAEAKEMHAAAAAEEAGVAAPVDGIDDRRAVGTSIGRLLAGGHVALADNQVTLDLTGEGRSLVLCSVLALTLDDLAVQGNQVRCVSPNDFVLVDTVAAALWTARVTGNRFQEMRIGRAVGGQLGAFASLASLAIMNTTTSNQMTGPYVALGALLVDDHNQRWP